MPADYRSGAEYAGTQSFEGQYAGTGSYPDATLQYFDFFYKGTQAAHTGYMPNEKLFEALATNSPAIKVLDVERRNLDSETMAAIVNCLAANTHVTELKLGRNVAFWSEQPDHFGLALAKVLAKNTTITAVDIKNNDIQEDAVEAIMEAMKQNTTVTSLDMADNFSRGKGRAIGEMLQANKTLTSLNLNVNQLSDEDSQAVLAAVDANTALRDFSAFNNGAVDKATRKRLRGFKNGERKAA